MRSQNPEMFSIAEAGFDQDKWRITEGIQTKYRQMVHALMG